MTKTLSLILLASVTIWSCPSAAAAQVAPSLVHATLEELMDIRVTSAARKSQRAEDVPAAIYVITQDDIRQSGLTTLPEILRLAPGVQVAQVSAARWAVSIRGFNSVYANKLLVLIDGRSVYSRTFSGVFWDLQDVMAADIDRIEIIRGAGGAVWGANAVNGVINIITLGAHDTQGLAVAVSAGTAVRGRAGVRYGGSHGNTAYRVFSEWSAYADSANTEPAPFSDRWHSASSGARLDWSRDADAVMAVGRFTTNRTRPGWLALTSFEPGAAFATDGESHSDEVSVLGRWTRTRTAGTVLQVQAFHTSTTRDEAIISLTERTNDLDLQYEARIAARHGLVMGAGYRSVDLAAGNTLTVQLGSYHLHTFSAFLQDEIAVRRNVAVTLGARLERDTFGGWDALPSIQAIWEAPKGQRLWAAASRTHRTPAITDRDLRLNFGVVPGPGLPIVLGVSGNPEYHDERFTQVQAGHRIRIGATAAIETTVFTGSYAGLPTYEPLEPRVELTSGPPHLRAGVMAANLLNARVSGVELNARWNPVPQWEIEALYARLHMKADQDPASLRPTAADTDGNAPPHQWEARTAVALRPGIETSVSLRRVGPLRVIAVPAYTRVDARAEFEVNSRLTAAVVGQNLTQRRHAEFASDIIFLISRIPRSARFDLRWAF
ncbi:MAG TPA: TonB-dependent receptor [Vicinamibacterales bacterium]|nr:TonB-dependent receptor [Vicinamibacterales bacterium]